ncbi:MAG: CcdB family protein [Methylobacter sp.]
MPSFDVCRNQNDLLQGLETRIVVPLRRRDRFSAVNLPANLTPVFVIDGMECLLETPKLATVPLRILKAPIASLASRQCEINAALDFLFQGF